jgi:tetratricopeptide (TPR) repeat protein
LGALAAGCAIPQPDVPVRRYLDGELGAVREFAEVEVEYGPPENLALVRNVQGQCELSMGELELAQKHFEQAAQIMGTWAVSSGEATGAIVGSESSKTYRGDPYEKAMNAFYLAFCYLVLGESDNARAALKRGILADAEVADEKYQADNALLFWMAGRMSALMGLPGDAEDFFKEARTAHLFALEHGARGDPADRVIAAPAAGNLVLLLPIGLGPEKYGDGLQNELARFRSQSHPATAARAKLGGLELGRSSILADVDYQANTLGGMAMQGIRRGKAVFKTASTISGIVLLNEAAKSDGDDARTKAIVGGGLLALGVLTSASADVRHWPTLPSTVQVLTAEVAPGEHTLVVDFLDERGRALPGLRHTAGIVVPESGEAWYLIPSLPPAADDAEGTP